MSTLTCTSILEESKFAESGGGSIEAGIHHESSKCENANELRDSLHRNQKSFHVPKKSILVKHDEPIYINTANNLLPLKEIIVDMSASPDCDDDEENDDDDDNFDINSAITYEDKPNPEDLPISKHKHSNKKAQKLDPPEMLLEKKSPSKYDFTLPSSIASTTGNKQIQYGEENFTERTLDETLSSQVFGNDSDHESSCSVYTSGSRGCDSNHADSPKDINEVDNLLSENMYLKRINKELSEQLSSTHRMLSLEKEHSVSLELKIVKLEARIRQMERDMIDEIQGKERKSKKIHGDDSTSTKRRHSYGDLSDAKDFYHASLDTFPSAYEKKGLKIKRKQGTVGNGGAGRRRAVENLAAAAGLLDAFVPTNINNKRRENVNTKEKVKKQSDKKSENTNTDEYLTQETYSDFDMPLPPNDDMESTASSSRTSISKRSGQGKKLGPQKILNKVQEFPNKSKAQEKEKRRGTRTEFQRRKSEGNLSDFLSEDMNMSMSESSFGNADLDDLVDSQTSSSRSIGDSKKKSEKKKKIRNRRPKRCNSEGDLKVTSRGTVLDGPDASLRALANELWADLTPKDDEQQKISPPSASKKKAVPLLSISKKGLMEKVSTKPSQALNSSRNSLHQPNKKPHPTQNASWD